MKNVGCGYTLVETSGK